MRYFWGCSLMHSGALWDFSGPQNQPSTNDMAGVEKEPGPAHRAVGLAPSAVSE